jgi:two-component system chemotaxis response regulator CheY
LFKKFRALVVDDDGTTRLMLRSMLEALEFASVDTAAGAEGAKLAFQTSPDQWPDIVLCDVNMKPTSGLELVAWFNAQPKIVARGIPVVMVTAHSDAPIVRRAMELGVSGYLVKPVQPMALRMRMEKALLPRTFG